MFSEIVRAQPESDVMNVHEDRLEPDAYNAGHEMIHPVIHFDPEIATWKLAKCWTRTTTLSLSGTQKVSPAVRPALRNMLGSFGAGDDDIKRARPHNGGAVSGSALG